MSHLVFNSAYDFYKLPENERIKLIGRTFKERQIVGTNSNWRYSKSKVTDTQFVVIGLAKDEFNYEIQQGVLFITPMLENYKDKSKWFRIGVKSPDDLDLDLDFKGEEVLLRGKIIKFIQKDMHKVNRRYIEILQQIQSQFNAGTISY